MKRIIQAKLLKYGGLYELVRKTGIIAIIDFAFATFTNTVSKRFYRLRGTDYGLLEALFLRDIARWSRYAYVVNEIKKLKTKGKILEVGSGVWVSHHSSAKIVKYSLLMLVENYPKA